MFGDNLKVHFFKLAVRENYIKTINTIFEQLDIHIEKFIPTPLSSALAVLKNDEKELGAISIDLGAGSTSISVFENNKLIFWIIHILIPDMIQGRIQTPIQHVIQDSTQESKQLGSAVDSLCDSRLDSELDPWLDSLFHSHLADSAIVTGIAILVFFFWISSRRNEIASFDNKKLSEKEIIGSEGDVERHQNGPL